MQQRCEDKHTHRSLVIFPEIQYKRVSYECSYFNRRRSGYNR